MGKDFKQSGGLLQRRFLRLLLPFVILPFLFFSVLTVYHLYHSEKSGFDRNFELISKSALGSFETELQRSRAALTALAVRIEGTNFKDSGATSYLGSAVSTNPQITFAAIIDSTGKIQNKSNNGISQSRRGMRLAKILSSSEGRGASPIFLSDDHVYFYMYAKLTDQGSLLLEVDISHWATGLQKSLANNAGLIAAVVPVGNYGDQVKLVSDNRQAYWRKMAVLKGTKGQDNIKVLESEYLVSTADLSPLGSQLIIALPTKGALVETYRAIGRSAAVLALIVIAIVLIVRSLIGEIAVSSQDLIGKIRKVAGGDYTVRPNLVKSNEVSQIAAEFGRAMEPIDREHSKLWVQNRSLKDLASCEDIVAVMLKSTELVSTHCGADQSWFLKHPGNVESQIYDTRSDIIGCHWNGHRHNELPGNSWPTFPNAKGSKLYEFIIRDASGLLGSIFVYYEVAPNERIDVQVSDLISIIEFTVKHRSHVNQNAKVSNEIQIAKSIGTAKILRGESSNQRRISCFHKPAQALGGSWFCVAESAVDDAVHVIMGGVDGQGMVPGITAAAVRGALDVIELLLKRKDQSFLLRSIDIKELFESLIASTAGQKSISMNSLIARVDFASNTIDICNQNYIRPIRVRRTGEVSSVEFLEVGASKDRGLIALETGDTIVFCSDAFSGNPVLKADVFSGLLFRKLEQNREELAAEVLKDQVVDLFRYYAQNQKLNSDVCFLVVQMQSAKLTAATGSLEASA